MFKGINGKLYQPLGGLSDAIWGQQNIDDARFNEAVERIQNRATPGHTGLGFKTSSYGQPNATWDRFHGLMMGMRDGVNGKLRINQTPGPTHRYDTRFDADQVDTQTGNTLAEDTYGKNSALKIPIYQLRRMYGLKD
jgi:hypothetical protein